MPDGQIKVAIAEDHPLARLGLVHLLETAHDIEVTALANDGEEALRLIQTAEPPDVLLLDLRMPGLSGVEVARRVSQENPSVAIVIMGATEDGRSTAQAVRAGANALVAKTAGASQVIDTVRMVARGHVVIDGDAWRAISTGRADRSGGGLTLREVEVLRCVARGLTNRQIAEELDISSETVKTHLERIRKRLGVRDRTDAVVTAMRAGILE